MNSHTLGALLLAGTLTVPLGAEMPEGFLDIFVAKVKLGKRMEFDAINRKMVDINRKNKGDTWLAYEIIYGEPNTIYFVSTRSNYAGSEQGTKSMLSAMTESLGKTGMQRMFDSFDATVESEHSEFRRRRWDLSASAPSDPKAYAELVGRARYLRLITIRTRPGKSLAYENALKEAKQALERANPGIPSLVSQGVAGEGVGVYHIANLVTSMADLDNIKPLQQVLGGYYGAYQETVASSVIDTRIMIGRMAPDISNPPEEIAAVDPKYWRPAPPPPPPAAPKPAETKK